MPKKAAPTKEMGYCVKCKEKREMINATKVKTKNNRNALKGECKKCGTTMMKFVK